MQRKDAAGRDDRTCQHRCEARSLGSRFPKNPGRAFSIMCAHEMCHINGNAGFALEKRCRYSLWLMQWVAA